MSHARSKNFYIYIYIFNLGIGVMVLRSRYSISGRVLRDRLDCMINSQISITPAFQHLFYRFDRPLKEQLGNIKGAMNIGDLP